MPPSIDTQSTHYALVVDAGSSGSRLQIYSWRDPRLERSEIQAEVRAAHRALAVDGGQTSRWWWWDSIKGKGRATISEMEKRALRRLVRVGKGVKGDDWVKRVEPGISSVAPEDIPGYLGPLLQHALAHIPPSKQAETPIYVLATAGMRLLSDESKHAILKATCDTLKRSYPFKLDEDCRESVRIISGEEEGIWGWVAVNYLMDGFGHAPELHHDSDVHDHLLPLAPLADAPRDGSSGDKVTPVDVHHHSPTFGFLDMGGASTQLAFSPTVEELARSKFPSSRLATISLRLLSGELVEWPVFAASWLGYGTNRVRERYLDTLIANSKDKQEVEDACLPTGLVIPSSDTSRPALKGKGDFSGCLTALKPLLAQDEPCPAHHCLFGGLPTPQIDFHRQDQRGFIGISEYWYTAQQVLGLGGVWDWSEWEQNMGAFCAQDWAEIERRVKEDKGWNGADVELSRLQTQCFKGAWISNVLHEGIGIPRLVDAGGNDTLSGGSPGDTNAIAEERARQKGLFQSMDEVRSTAISWTLGKVIIEASRAVSPAQASRLQAYIDHIPPGFMILYGIVALIVLAAVYSLFRRRGWRGLGAGLGFARLRTESIEDGLPRKKGRNNLRSWSRRITNTLRRAGPERPAVRRTASMPLSTPRSWSQPPSPGLASSNSTLELTSAPASPPRGGASGSGVSTARPSRPRQSSGYQAGYEGGWNDPPMNLLSRPSASGYDSSSGADDEWGGNGKTLRKKRSGLLTPSADHALSRNSSRANLSELGLAQRSRAGTPNR